MTREEIQCFADNMIIRLQRAQDFRNYRFQRQLFEMAIENLSKRLVEIDAKIKKNAIDRRFEGR